MSMDTTPIQCYFCKSQFISEKNQPAQKFCSRKCQQKSWCAENREKRNQSVREYRKRKYEENGCYRDAGQKAKALKEWMIELKSQPCQDCKLSFEVCCMDFDHRDGTVKSYNVGSMFAHHYSRELIETELAKCDLVCANCHRIRTRDRRLGGGYQKKVV